MNKFERLIYDVIKSNPRLKMKVRDAYQAACDLLPVTRNRAAYPVNVREGFFCGFHDKCPWSADDRYLLAHRELIPLRMPGTDDPLEVGYFDECAQGHYKAVGQTRAWNWHQGAQLQWLGRSEQIVFNDYDGQKHIARIVDHVGQSVKVLPCPVAALTMDGSRALSYSFARLRGSPHGYAYANGVDPEAQNFIPQEDGLWTVDVATGSVTRLFTVKEIARVNPDPSMEGAFHYFSHCQYSPSGRRFKFFHRWTLDDNRNCTRMLTADADGGGLHVFPTAGMVSHVSWRGDEHLVAYARTAVHGDAYYDFHDRTDQVTVFGQESFSSDGHPAMSKDGEWMLTDTYADRFRRRHLILYHLSTQRRYDVAMFYSPKSFAGVSIADHLQCDFHPRWSRANDKICFDSAHTGKRALCVMTLGCPPQKPFRTI